MHFSKRLFYINFQCGCDYTEKIEGIGPGTAYKLIKEYKNIERILEHV